MNWRWTENTERVSDGDWRILGEDERGDMFIPDRKAPRIWRRRFDARNPLHWGYYLRSRTTNRIAFLESIR